MALQRCPECLEGQVFVGTVKMKVRCTLCGHRFEREQGYFQGAMYVSYALAIGALVLLTFAVEVLAPGLQPEGALLVSVPMFLLLVPALFRYSRVIWMHLNYRAF